MASPGHTDVSAGISDPTQAAGPAEQMLIISGNGPNDQDLHMRMRAESYVTGSFQTQTIVERAPRNSEKVPTPSGNSTPDAVTDRDRSPVLLSPTNQVNETGGFAMQDTFSRQIPQELIMVKDGQMFMGNLHMESERRSEAQ